MKCSTLFDLDTTNLVFYALQRSMYENAVQVGGGYLVASNIRESLQGKYCFSLAFVSDIVTPESITAGQICEYNEHHKIACETCEYFAAERICKAYGYIMERAAAMINGEEYASKWAQQWETAAKNAVLIVYNAVTRDALQKALIVSEKDLTQAMQIDEYADIEAMQAEAQRIAKEYNTKQERSKDEASESDKKGGDKITINWQALKADKVGVIDKYIAYRAKKRFCICIEVYALKRENESQRQAQRVLYDFWAHANNIQTIHGKKIVGYETFVREVAKACGVEDYILSISEVKKVQPIQKQ